MKTNHWVRWRWFALCMAALGIFFFVPGAPGSRDVLPVQAAELQQAAKGEDLLAPGLWIMLPKPDISTLDIPAGLRRPDIEALAHQIAMEKAAPVLRLLEQMIAAGQVKGYTLAVERNAILAWAEPGSDLGRISASLPFPSAPARSGCLSSGNGDLVALVSARSQLASLQGEMRGVPPSYKWIIVVSLLDSYFWGYLPVTREAQAGTATYTVTRNGKPITSGTTDVANDGYYFVSRSWHECEPDWFIEAGDLITVNYRGGTYTTVVAQVSADLNPATQKLVGSTSPGKTVFTRIFTENTTNCSSSVQDEWVAVDGSGKFSKVYATRQGEAAPFLGDAYADIYVVSSNQTATLLTVSAHHLRLSQDYPTLYGTIEAGKPFTLTHQGSGFSDLYSGVGGPQGDFSVFLSRVPQPGENFTLVFTPTVGLREDQQEQMTTLSLAVVPFRANIAPGNVISGKTAPNRIFKMQYGNRTGFEFSISTTCLPQQGCKRITADALGDFSFSADFNIYKLDQARVEIWDSQHNQITMYQYSFPGLVYNGEEIVGGTWFYGKGTITGILKNFDGTMKATIQASMYNGQFQLYFPTIDSDDTVIATDGTYTETIPLGVFTAKLNYLTGEVTGEKPANAHLLANFADYRPGNYWTYSCQEKLAGREPSENYSFTFNTGSQGSADDVSVLARIPNGNYYYTWSHAQYAKIYLVTKEVDGYIPVPHTQVNVDRLDGALQLLEHKEYMTGDIGLFFITFSGAIEAGQTIRVSYPGGPNLDIPIPVLTVQQNAGAQTVYGIAPASSPLLVIYEQAGLPCSWDFCANETWAWITSNAAGTYSESFAGKTYLNGTDMLCYPIQVGSPCSRAKLEYHNPLENVITQEGPDFTPVSSDANEPNNAYTAATPIQTIASGTFHDLADTDWYALVVGPYQVGMDITIQTILLGQTADTVLKLYDTNGTTLLAQDDNSGGRYASLIRFTPAATGTYYIQVLPADPNKNAANCGASYSLLIAPYRLKLPLIAR